MNELITGLRNIATTSRTENDMVTYTTSFDKCLDLFFRAGAMRLASDTDIIDVWHKAYTENPLKALKILFWIRDIRGGAGERRVFRVIVKHLISHAYNDIRRVLGLFPHYGRWDDLYYTIPLFESARCGYIVSEIEGFIRENIKNEKVVGLLAKWLPREGKAHYKEYGNKIRKMLGLSKKEYRTFLSANTSVVENRMCMKLWDSIEYDKVPSVAFHKYNKAWYRNDLEGIEKFIASVKKGEKTIHAEAIFPHTIVKTIVDSIVDYKYRGERPVGVEAYNQQWLALPDYIPSDLNFIPVCDVSGSMSNGDCLPMYVSVALGIYCAERNKSVFKDKFITFSNEPTFVELSRGDLYDKVFSMELEAMAENTDLNKVFNLILNTALKNSVPASDMPSNILIISDMEFDRSVGNDETAMQMIRRKYIEAGYSVPNVIFWNVNSRGANIPVRFNESGVALVSGFSPAILKNLLSGELTSLSMMDSVIESNRYSIVETLYKGE